MAESYLRLLEILRLLPRYPLTISTSEIRIRTGDKGFEVTAKTIQRDLQAISSIFPVISVEDTKPYRWGWMQAAGVLDIPSLDPKTALSFCLLNRYASTLLPRSVLAFLKPYLDRAETVLRETGPTPLKNWVDRVAVIPKGQPLMKAEFDPKVRDAVYDAVLSGKQIQITYRRLGATKAKTYPVNPLGLVFRNEVIYLVATAKDYTEPAQFPLHRIKEAQLLDTDAVLPGGVSLKDYVNRGEFSFPFADLPDQTQIRLEVIIDRYFAQRLEETPVSEDQTIEGISEEKVRLRATVLNSLELREWLRGYGASVEVVSPEFLRQEFAEMVKKMQAMYRKKG